MIQIKHNNNNSIIGIITNPISRAGSTPLSNLASILYGPSNNINNILSNEAFVLTNSHNNLNIFRIRHISGVTVFTRIIRYVYTQFRICWQVLLVNHNIKLWIFLFGETLILPMLVIKLLGLRSILIYTGSPANVGKIQNDSLSIITEKLQEINYFLSDAIIIYSERLVNEQCLEKYRSKIYIAHEHFLDLSKFRNMRQIDQRNNVIGYIGRLTRAKGIYNFIEAIPLFLNKSNDVSILIGGEGPECKHIKEYVYDHGLEKNVSFNGWISHNDLPYQLNNIKLLVLPSYSEGLPNIIIEAMACGTPVLATSIGAIPDIIEDGVTGFLLDNNSPLSISQYIVSILNRSDLETISENARLYIANNFTYISTVKEFQKIIKKFE